MDNRFLIFINNFKLNTIQLYSLALKELLFSFSIHFLSLMSIPNISMAFLSTSNLEKFIFSSNSISNRLFYILLSDFFDALAITELE